MAIVDEPAGLTDASDTAVPDAGRMTLFEHLAELRKRLVISIAAIVVGAVVAWCFYNRVLHFMLEPYASFLRHHPNENISKGQLVTNGPLEGLTTRLKVSGYLGFALGSPVVLWELWRFITPGLHKNEKRYAVPFVLSAVGLFSLGVGTAIFIFPRAIDWLISISGKGVVPLFSPSKYFTLYVLMCLVFGLVFLYPILLMFLMLAGVVPSSKWRKWRRPAIVVIAAVAAIVTPSSDPFSFMAMAIPMYVFYEASIILGRILKK
jgi:sec-independent protein translocase protein TatC